MPPRGIIGDASYGTDLPVMEVEEADLAADRNMAKFSRTKEFKALKEHIEGRIKYYQTFLPDGRIVGVNQSPTGEEWLIANTVIAELRALITSYEVVNQSVQEAKVADRSQS